MTNEQDVKEQLFFPIIDTANLDTYLADGKKGHITLVLGFEIQPQMLIISLRVSEEN